MKIAIVSAIYPFKGGIAQFAGAMHKGFENLGHDVKAFTFKRQYPDFLYPGGNQYVSDTDKVDKIASHAIIDTINPLSYFKTAKAIKEFSPDIVVFKFWLPFFGPAFGKIAKLLKKNAKIITAVDNVIPHEKRPFDKVLTRYFLKQNHGIFCMSQQVQNDLDKWLPNCPSAISPHPIYTIFGEGIDRKEACEALELDPKNKYLLSFGYIRDYKGVDLSIKALTLLPSHYHLIIAGESYSSFAPYEAMIRELKLESRVHTYVRYIPQEEVKLFYSASDIALMTYKSATQSGVCSVAINFEIPMVATPVGGLTEMVRNDVNGFLSDDLSPEAISQAIIKCETHDQEKLKQGQIELKKELSWETYCQRLLDFSNRL